MVMRQGVPTPAWVRRRWHRRDAQNGEPTRGKPASPARPADVLTPFRLNRQGDDLDAFYGPREGRREACGVAPRHLCGSCAIVPQPPRARAREEFLQSWAWRPYLIL
jgi:hypothetical protein